MIKNNKWKVIISSIIVLLPCFAGLIFWNKLPNVMTVHFGTDGNADGFAPKLFAVVGIPVILLLMHLLCLFVTSKDKGNRDQSKKALGIIFWIVPAISLFTSSATYFAMLDSEFNINSIVFALFGALFIVIGNYLPKCKQNLTLGIKIKWTLANEENWNATHRFAGKVWVIAGLLFLLCVFLPEEYLMYYFIPVMLAMIIIPSVYSALYYKKQVKEGKAPEKPEIPMKKYKKIYIISIILVVIVLAVCLAVMFTGEIVMEYGDEALKVKASYFEDITVEYEAIDSIEFRKECPVGVKINGFNFARLLMGGFNNEEFGNYIRYTYTNCKSCVILEVNSDVVVLSGKDETRTKEIMQELIEKVE